MRWDFFIDCLPFSSWEDEVSSLSITTYIGLNCRFFPK